MQLNGGYDEGYYGYPHTTKDLNVLEHLEYCFVAIVNKTMFY